MLVLTRKQHQSLFLGDSIRITVLDVRGGQVRLGIEAPRTLSVVREEVLDDLALSNQEACTSNGCTDTSLDDLAALVRSQIFGEEE